MNRPSRYWLGTLLLQGHPSDENVCQICNDIRERWCRHAGHTVKFSYRVKVYNGYYIVGHFNGAMYWKKAETPEEMKKIPADYYHLHIAFYSDFSVREDFIKYLFTNEIELTPISKECLNDYMGKLGDFDEGGLELAGLPHEISLFSC